MTMFALCRTTLKVIIFLCLHRLEFVAGQVQTRAPYFAPYTLGCKLTKAGREYAGPLNTTSSGRRCQPWNSDQPHLNYYKETNNYPEGSASDAGNRCRNPDVNYHLGVWCYTTTPSIRWDVCDVRFCECLLPSDTMGIHYEGLISRTRSGQTCRRWSHQFPNRHPFNASVHFPDASITDAYNYCRNPNGSRPDGPWCYVNSLLDWNYCRIPVCNLTSPILPTRQIMTELTTISRRVTSSFRTPEKISSRETSERITSSRDAVTERSFTIRWKPTSSASIQSGFSTEFSKKASLTQKTTSATFTSSSPAKFSTESSTKSSLVPKATSAIVPSAKFSTESSTKSSLVPKAASAIISSSKLSADSTRSSLSYEIYLVTTSASSSASKTHGQRSEANENNSLHIVKIVVPLLGVIVLIVALAFFVWKRHRIFRNSWSRFSNWRYLLSKREPSESVSLPERGNQ